MDKQRKSASIWKNRFYYLLGINLILFLIFIILLFWPFANNEISTNPNTELEESSEFIVRTSKENLNNLVNAYIEQFTENSNQNYQLIIDEDVHLVGELPVFSTTVPLSVHFDPHVEENGDIVLEQKSISLGLLELPNKRIMDYLGRFLPMPEWVTVKADEEEIYIAVTEIDIGANFEVGVETIDLEDNNIAIRIGVPFETLELENVNFIDSR